MVYSIACYFAQNETITRTELRRRELFDKETLHTSPHAGYTFMHQTFLTALGILLSASAYTLADLVV